VTRAEGTRDLIVLVADKNMESTINGILSRRQSLKIRAVSWDVFVHMYRDAGCLTAGADFLRTFARRYAHGIVMFDRKGSGQEGRTAQELEAQVEQRLSRTGWGDLAAAVVLDPELEVWVWSDSPHVERVLGWAGRSPPLRHWLDQEGFLGGTQAKPHRPKEAVEKALRLAAKPRSSSIYLELARTVALTRCTDRAFGKLRSVLTKWFAGAP
jgi:hypothetical protein